MDDLDLLMYLDEGLVRNLSSLVLSGYIDIRTTKITQDSTLTGSLSTDWREHTFDEDREGSDAKEGFRGCNISKAAHIEQGNSQGGVIEDREFIRREEEIKKIYTTFTLHSQLQSGLSEKNLMRAIGNQGIEDGTVKAGDYVKIKGILTSESVNSYIDSLLNLFNCYGCDTLNSIIKPNTSKNLSTAPFTGLNLLDFSTVSNMLTHLDTILSQNSTQDMILTCGDTPVVITVNKNFFMDNNSYIYDKVNCPCTVFGKVISVTQKGNCISLLRKTGQHDYYEKLLDSYHLSHCQTLESSGIIIPTKPRLKCDGTTIVVMPISMSI